MIQILKSTSEFTPHLAVCHMEFNGGSANAENIPLITKAVKDNEKLNQVLEQLGLGEDKEIIQKASYRNIQNMLQTQLSTMMTAEDAEYPAYIWIEDFDENVVVFEYREKRYYANYSLSDTGIVFIVGEIKEVIEQRVYVTADGSALVLKGLEAAEVEAEENPAIDAEVTKGEAKTSTIDNKEEGTEMTELEIEALVQKAKEDAREQVRAEMAAELAEAELKKEAGNIVKGFAFIAEDEVEHVVKAMVEMGDAMTVIVKAFEAANAKIAEVEAEKEKIKEEFAVQKSVDDKPEVTKTDFADSLAKKVKARQEAKAAAASFIA